MPVRPYVSDDRDALVDALVELRSTSLYPYVPDPVRATLIEWLERTTYVARFVVTIPGAGVVGHVQLVSPAEDTSGLTKYLAHAGVATDHVWELTRLFVHPRWTAHGFGRELATYAASYARSHGRRTVLWVLYTQSAAISLYRRLGWVPLGVHHDHPAGPLHVFATPE